METIGIGVVGAGRIAVGYHLPALAAVKGARLVGVADVAPGRAEEIARRFGFEHALTDYRRLLERPDVHAICLLTQYETHREVILAAADAGKHVFTQKPLTGSAAEGEEIVRAVRRAGIRLVTSFMHNYFPETRVVKRLLGDGAIGRLQFLRQRNATHNSYARAVELRGATWDIGPHGIGMIQHLTGARIVRVQAMMDVFNKPPAERDVNDGRPVDTLAVMNYTLSDGRLVNHEVQWTAEAGTLAWNTELFGECGGILLRPHTGEGLVALSQRPPDSEVWAGRGERRSRWEHLPVEPEQPRGLFHHQLFVDDVRFDRYESASPEDGLATLRVLEAAYRSAAEGSAVDIAYCPKSQVPSPKSKDDRCPALDLGLGTWDSRLLSA
ncbi:MAG: Gfo/Idh/MocA family oxidoreductase [Chloroflexi bacterium]|nr:Gfo/Idh/MocA family oxidoreductase [Chloroflexota bacterium]